MSDETVAAFMPVLNEADRIERAIGSLQRQTHPVSRLVVVDGGSTDATHDVVRSAAEDVAFAVDLLVRDGAGVRESSQVGAEAAVAHLLDEERATAAADDRPAGTVSGAVDGDDGAASGVEADGAGAAVQSDGDGVPDTDDGGLAPDDGVVVRLEGDSALDEAFVERAVAALGDGASVFGAPVRPHDPDARAVRKRLFALWQNADALPKGRGMAFGARDFRAVHGYRLFPGEDVAASPVGCLEDGILVAKLRDRGRVAFDRETCVYSTVPSSTATSPRRWLTALRIERELGPTGYFTRIANPVNTALYAAKSLAGRV